MLSCDCTRHAGHPCRHHPNRCGIFCEQQSRISDWYRLTGQFRLLFIGKILTFLFLGGHNPFSNWHHRYRQGAHPTGALL